MLQTKVAQNEISYKKLNESVSLSIPGVKVERSKDGIVILSEVPFENEQYFII